ncbi:MAG: formylmethanofuran dehydrogenase subunit E family protein [Planctomycetes bacterium]|nr:formylmethanofuran dehydrogenase subunit E family protein [Planctomycetota bacterium]
MGGQTGSPAGGHSHLRHYQAADTDAPWLAKAGDLHGHLGPWVVVGAMIGRDAIERLNTDGQWEIEVICWMPQAKQRPPFTCILDGLQASSGATMGKRNIRMDDGPAITETGEPVVHVVHKRADGTVDAGVVYEMAPVLADILARSSPDRIEAIAREIAGHPPDELFVIRSMTAEELTRTRLDPTGSTGRARTHSRSLWSVFGPGFSVERFGRHLPFS